MRSCRRSRPRDRKRGEPVVRCPTEAIARRPTSTSRGSTCASSRPCSRPAARGTTAECVAEGSSGAGAGGLLLRRHTHRELCDGGPIKALVRFRAYACLVVGDSNSQVDRRRGGRGPRPCVGTMLGTAIGAPLFFSQCSAVSSPARISRLRFHESHKSGGRPAPTDGYAEYDFRLRTEEQLAAGLSVLAPGARRAEAIVPDDRYSGIAHRGATDVAASRCRHFDRALRGDSPANAIVPSAERA